MIKVKITRNTVANKQPVFEGEIHELPDLEAKYLIGLGKAVGVGEAKSAPAIETAELSQANVETADVKTPRSKKG